MATSDNSLIGETSIPSCRGFIGSNPNRALLYHENNCDSPGNGKAAVRIVSAACLSGCKFYNQIIMGISCEGMNTETGYATVVTSSAIDLFDFKMRDRVNDLISFSSCRASLTKAMERTAGN